MVRYRVLQALKDKKTRIPYGVAYQYQDTPPQERHVLLFVPHWRTQKRLDVNDLSQLSARHYPSASLPLEWSKIQEWTADPTSSQGFMPIDVMQQAFPVEQEKKPSMPLWNIPRWLVPLLRLCTRQSWMPTIESSYVIQRLECKRQQAWQDYESMWYGPTAATYLEKVETTSRHNGWPLRALPPEIDPLQLRPLRLRWLQMTEALAECYAFSDPDMANEPANWQPNLLHAADLLAHAGEVQHEIVADLQRCTAFIEGEHRKQWQQDIQKETRLACHFFDLSAHCIEAWLNPDWSLVTDKRTRAERWGYFYHRDETSQKQALQHWYWHTTLRNRHWLLALLEPHAIDTYPLGAFDWSQGFSEPPPGGEATTNFDMVLAQCARDASEASLWLAWRRGDPSIGLPLLYGHAREDKLLMLQTKLAQAESLVPEHDLSRHRVQHAIERLIHLWGLAVEQDMDYLHAGSVVWYERCELAADLYTYEKSARVRRLYALLHTLASEQPGQSPAEPPVMSATGEMAHSLVEIG